MDDFICMHNLLDQVSGFLVIHRPDFLDPVIIRFLKSFVLLLQVLEPCSELLVLVSQIDVLLLELGRLDSELLCDFRQSGFCPSLSLGESLLGLIVYAFSLKQYFVIEFQLLLVERIDSFHVLHALFQDLHLGLELDFLLILLVSILTHDIFELSGILFFIMLTLGKILLFEVTMFIEQILDLVFVARQDVVPFVFKFGFNGG